MDFLMQTLAVCAVSATVIYVIHQIKVMFITHTFGVSRVTDDGETLTATASTSIFKSHEDRYQVVTALMDFGDRRKEFTDRRFKEHCAKELALQEQAKGKDKSIRSV